jgi:hypothetical protein
VMDFAAKRREIFMGDSSWGIGMWVTCPGQQHGVRRDPG